MQHEEGGPQRPGTDLAHSDRWGLSRSVNLRRLAVVFGFAIVLGVLGTVGVVLWALAALPRSLPSAELETLQPVQGSKLYDENDELFAELKAERRIFVPLTRVPRDLQAAILAVEDSRFYSHFGVDPVGIARAIYQNVRRGRIVEGGSTITQQLAKTLSLTFDKSLGRKVKEAVLALALERRYSKDEILEMYLNRVYLGHGAYGVEAAARTYFGKSVTGLSLAEAALLAGLPRAPMIYSPFRHPDLARRRRSHVLSRMVVVGALTPPAARRAEAADIGVLPPDRRHETGQYFVEHVRGLLAETYGEEVVFQGGLNVHTTISPRMQRLAEKSLREGIRALESRPRAVRQRPEGAILTIEARTGFIKAMVGGADFFESEFNRAVQARRQPGSAFKPFVYIAALEAGLTPATLIDDRSVSYAGGHDDRSWMPLNYDRKFRGRTTLQRGLEESVNVVTVRLQERIGIHRTVEVARRLGIRSPLHKDLALALGSSELSLLELTFAYGALANQGVWVPPAAIRYITDASGRLLEGEAPHGERVLSPQIAYIITHMLMGVVERGTGVGARVLDRPLAAKTGTTNGFSDAWFMGYTPTLVTGVWVGYDRPRSLGQDGTGTRVALPIWVNYMSAVLARTPPDDFPVPDGVVLVPVDLDGGGMCARPAVMAFLRGTEPQTRCGGLPDAVGRIFRWLLSPFVPSEGGK